MKKRCRLQNVGVAGDEPGEQLSKPLRYLRQSPWASVTECRATLSRPGPPPVFVISKIIFTFIIAAGFLSHWLTSQSGSSQEEKFVWKCSPDSILSLSAPASSSASSASSSPLCESVNQPIEESIDRSIDRWSLRLRSLMLRLCGFLLSSSSYLLIYSFHSKAGWLTTLSFSLYVVATNILTYTNERPERQINSPSRVAFVHPVTPMEKAARMLRLSTQS